MLDFNKAGFLFFYGYVGKKQYPSSSLLKIRLEVPTVGSEHCDAILNDAFKQFDNHNSSVFCSPSAVKSF